MSVTSDQQLPKVGSPVTTACKGIISYDADTPAVLFRGERIYFCMPACLKAFQDDPKKSCLADEINKQTE